LFRSVIQGCSINSFVAAQRPYVVLLYMTYSEFAQEAHKSRVECRKVTQQIGC
jgi:hypothetical protein